MKPADIFKVQRGSVIEGLSGADGKVEVWEVDSRLLRADSKKFGIGFRSTDGKLWYVRETSDAELVRGQRFRTMRAWEDVEDPDGRLCKGMLAKWRFTQADEPDMEILALCAPMGLYLRPHILGKETWEIGSRGVPCKADEPGAKYQPNKLMVRFRYLDTGNETTGRAVDIVEWSRDELLQLGTRDNQDSDQGV